MVGVLCRGGYYDDIKKEQCDETGTQLQFGGLSLKKNEGVYYFPTNGYYPFGTGTEHFGTTTGSAAKIFGGAKLLIIMTILCKLFI